jgi:uncharacterized membrane protein YkoI
LDNSSVPNLTAVTFQDTTQLIEHPGNSFSLGSPGLPTKSRFLENAKRIHPYVPMNFQRQPGILRTKIKLKETPMTQKTAMIISAVLTAFLLVLGGAIATRVSQPETVAVAAPAATTAAPAVAPTTAPDVVASAQAQVDQVQALMLEREAAYRKLVDQANEQLKQAYQQQQATTVKTSRVAPAQAQPQAQPAAASPTAPSVSISPDAALSIASAAAGKSGLMRGPELVLYNGVVAYEILFGRGAFYVDANTGQILSNGGSGGGKPAPSGAPAPTTPPPSGGGEHGDDGGGGGHDD